MGPLQTQQERSSRSRIPFPPKQPALHPSCRRLLFPVQLHYRPRCSNHGTDTALRIFKHHTLPSRCQNSGLARARCPRVRPKAAGQLDGECHLAESTSNSSIDSLQGNDTELPNNSSFETFQPPPQPNPYLDSAMNGTTFYQSAPAFQQPVC